MIKCRETVGREDVWRDCLPRITAGDSSALALLYDGTHVVVYSIAWNILGNSADAEEVALDVYSYVWRSSSLFDARRGTVLAWLIMLARSRAIDRRRALLTNGAAHALERNAAPDAGLYVSPVCQERRVMIDGALARLSPGERKLIELAFYSGLSHQELAEHLQTPLGTVKSRIRLTLARLRQIMEAHA